MLHSIVLRINPFNVSCLCISSHSHEPLTNDLLQEPIGEGDLFLTSDMEASHPISFDTDSFPCLADELQEQVKTLEHNIDTRNQESSKLNQQQASIKDQQITSITFAHGLPRGSPFAAALHNADCIRQAIPSPWPDAWAGCLECPWCNKERAHQGSCSTRAIIPGLSAYLPEELAAVGLPFTPELLTPLPPPAAAKANAAADAYAAHLKSIGAKPSKDSSRINSRKHTVQHNINNNTSSGEVVIQRHSMMDSLTASDNDSNNAEDDGDIAYAGVKDNKTTTMENRNPMKLIDQGSFGDGTDNETASEELRSSLTAEAKLRPSPHAAGGGEISAGPAKKARRHHHHHHHDHNTPAAKHHRHRHHDNHNSEDMHASLDMHATPHHHHHHTNKQRQYHRQHHHHGISKKGYSLASSLAVEQGNSTARGSHGTARMTHTAAATKGPTRRSPPVWIRGEVTDPRTGEVLTAVPPATFCTQCGALNTPVWRAGPFGHKTLCNACGVRYMKVAQRRK